MSDLQSFRLYSNFNCIPSRPSASSHGRIAVRRTHRIHPRDGQGKPEYFCAVTNRVPCRVHRPSTRSKHQTCNPKSPSSATLSPISRPAAARPRLAVVASAFGLAEHEIEALLAFWGARFLGELAHLTLDPRLSRRRRPRCTIAVAFTQ